MADLPFDLPDATLAERLSRALDPDRKIVRALEALGPVAGRDVVLLDGGDGFAGTGLAELGARVRVSDRLGTGIEDASADVVVALWSAVLGPGGADEAAAVRILRPGGRLLVVHDYGRDEVARLFPREREQYGAWSQRKGPFLMGGWRVRVIHTRWRFESVEACTAFLADAFGEAGAALAPTRPHLAYNVAVYHRTKEPAAAAA